MSYTIELWQGGLEHDVGIGWASILKLQDKKRADSGYAKHLRKWLKMEKPND